MPSHPLPPGLHPDTLAQRVAMEPSQYGENSEALFLTSGYVQPSAELSARRLVARKKVTPMAAREIPR
jgi:O-succinylhomoserine sulfhydrylase